MQQPFPASRLVPHDIVVADTITLRSAPTSLAEQGRFGYSAVSYGRGEQGCSRRVTSTWNADAVTGKIYPDILLTPGPASLGAALLK